MWIKDSDEEQDFGRDWSTTIGEDTITSSDWVVETGLTVGIGPKAPFISGALTIIWLSGGTPGVEYTLTNTIHTLGGRTYEAEMLLRVKTDAVPVPDYNGCVWPLEPACLTETWDGYPDAVRERAANLASSTLYRLTGYRVGGCPVTVRPRPQNGSCAIPATFEQYSHLMPLNWAGQWINYPCFGGFDPRVVELPAPVGRIDEVKVDGVALSTTDYKIMDEHALVWIGTGEAPWPLLQDVLVPDTQAGTFSVTYLNAYPPDSLAAYAAALLAMEFAKACDGKACKLPTNVVSIVRQGVSYQMQTGAFPDGKTGIREVDAFIEHWNPRGRQRSSVIVPGSAKVHVVR